MWELGKHLGISNKIIEAEPTDGLWNDGRNDKDQLGMSYSELEKAMEDKNDPNYKKYLEIRKKNLKSLGIKHDNFVSEKKIVSNKEVENVIKFLEANNFVYKGKIKAPAGEDKKDWIEKILKKQQFWLYLQLLKKIIQKF